MVDENDRDDPADIEAEEGSEIAIIGMACRFPGASTIDAFWRNLRNGVESLVELTDEELRAAGVPPEHIADPSYVRRASVIEGIEDFDARFFGYTPQEATIMDPQQRLFLECAWEVCEHAGYDPSRYPKPVGVFTGSKTNTYLFNVVAQRARFPTLDNFQIALGNDLAAMATRVSFKLDLRGPSYALHTACSTALVAVHLACQSLLLDECAMAIAGGAAINVPQKKGYLYQRGGILSPDGSCRTFDAQAAGSNFGNGAGAVMLKRLADARRDGDTIYAVIRGSATNNDGARKASFTAPGVEGQTAVLLEAMACAGVAADDISYVEAHGTATDLGDSIEMLALTQAFGASTARRGFCAIGSAKTNLGHLETAAGLAGLIKTALALQHREIPPSLHFESPNPKIDLAASPFFVNAERRPWPAAAAGRRRLAGVSSFGIGSTNAHVILEEPPAPAATDADRPWQLLLLSARSAAALDAMSRSLGLHLEEHPEIALADAAFTLALGRKQLEHRRAVVCRDRADAVALFTGGELAVRAPAAAVEVAGRRAVFLVPGLGEQSVDMGLGLYQREPVFRAAVDRSSEILLPLLGVDLREVLYPRGTGAPEEAGDGRLDLKAMLGRGGLADGAGAAADPAASRLDRTLFAQPALFVVEHALAQLFLARGVKPQGMIGYSLGEYVCACLAGVLTLEDALRLVAGRAALIDRLPAGAMLAVTLGEEALSPRLAGHGLSLAAVNGVTGCVASGPPAGVAALETELAAAGIACRRLATAHAFHSAAMAGLAGELTALAATLERKAPAIPYVSNVTGTWITAAEATDPAYWARHLVSPVRFAEGLGALLAEGDRALLEVGPGQSLNSFARLHPGCAKRRPVIAAMHSRHGRGSAAAAFLAALGELWQAGVTIDWAAHSAGERRRRVPLPTYPFERQRYWLDPDPETLARTDGRELPKSAAPVKNPDLGEWLYQPVWRPAPWPVEGTARLSGVWLLFADRLGVAEALAARLAARGAEVALVTPGDRFARPAAGRFTVRPAETADYMELLAGLADRRLERVVHLWNVAPVPDEPSAGGEAAFRAAQDLGFYSLIALAQALVRQKAVSGGLEIVTVSCGVHAVAGGEPLAPERSTLLGPAVVIPQEHPQIVVRAVDLDPADLADLADPAAPDRMAERLVRELGAPAAEAVVAHRGEERRVRGFEPLALPPVAAPPFREGGVYLITGGLGSIGLNLAGQLARTCRARLVLTRRSPLPPRAEWDGWLREHGEEDGTSRLIARLRALEAAGAEVLAIAADVAVEASMRAVVAAALERFGVLHGVIHAAGILAQDSFKTVQLTSRAECELHFGPKVYGLYVLERVLADLRLDFVTLYSSLSAILGGLGYVGYATANLFMDYFAARHNRRGGGTPWQSVDWDSWHASVDTGGRGGLGTTLTELAMTPAEGFTLLERMLSFTEPRPLVVSTGALAPRLAQWVELRALRSAAASSDGAGAAGRARQVRKKLSAGAGLEAQVAEVWSRVLGVADMGRDENFFDLGGNSLLGMQLVAELGKDFGVEVEPVALFEAPTIAAMARYLSPGEAAAEAPRRRHRRREPSEGSDFSDVAVIGLHGRFPGAPSLAALWNNLREGRDTISFFSDAELRQAGVDEKTLADPLYIKARPILDGIECFDAPFFGYTPREAEIMDPQHRIFLESAWAAFEDAGYDIESHDGAVGVYAGASLSSYMANLYSNPDLVESVGTFQTLIGNEKDSLTTKVSYNLNLRGPSLAVQTFCSTSLVAVHLACQALIHGECDMALAGGVSVIVPQVSGYRYEPGSIGSADGRIHAFDAKASGIVFGNGLGTVVLKRLADALADGDSIRAVIKGTAVNNDGAGKAGFSATSVEGQAEVVATALEVAGVPPDTIGYMEAHGTGTPLGDPIEMAALNKAFRAQTDRRRFCPIGSVKTNLGHLDRAAGISGLIKTILALEKEEIPPSLHFKEPNPAIDFVDNAFYVVTERTPWPRGGAPRRAGVNSLGLGGTNAHAVLEEAPPVPPAAPGRPWQLLVLSARTPEALEQRSDDLAAHLEEHAGQPLADVAYTLQIGRKAMTHRRCLVVPDGAHGEAAALLRERTPQRVASGAAPGREPRLVFLFPGLGGQYTDMGRGLYASEPVFRAAVDRCAEMLRPELGLDLREVLYPAAAETAAEEKPGLDLRRMLGRGEESAAGRRLRDTAVAQPALFVIEYALTELLASWGLHPWAMVGYSLGEYAAACVGGMLSLEDALRLVARRARLIQGLEAGAMLAVPLAEDEVIAHLTADLSLAAVNGPQQSVVAGPPAAVAALEERLAAGGVVSRRLQTTHAFHSSMMEEAGPAFTELLREIGFSAPRIPWLSNVTGTWMSTEEATDPAYWARHMVRPVRFSESLETLAAAEGDLVFLELGPGQTLGSLALQHPAFGRRRKPAVMAALRHDYEERDDLAHLYEAVGRLWLAGIQVDWPALGGGAPRRRVPLPSYPFARHSYWVESKVHGYTAIAQLTAAPSAESLLYFPSWQRRQAPRLAAPAGLEAMLDPRLDAWLLFVDPADGGCGAAFEERLRATGRTVWSVAPGGGFADLGGGAFTLRAGDAGDAAALAAALPGSPAAAVHLWSLAAPVEEELEAARKRGLDGLLAVLLALRARHRRDLSLWTISAAAFDVSGEETPRPAAATVLAATRVLPREMPGILCRAIDVIPPANGSAAVLAGQILAEIAAAAPEQIVAYRGGHRWVPALEPATAGSGPASLRAEGVYLITGGTNSRGFAFASYLARHAPGARLALVEPAGDGVSGHRTRRIERLREAGAEVLELTADLTDPAAVAGVAATIATIAARFGALHGVIHAAEPAGVEAAYATAEESGERETAAARAFLAVKAEGARLLAAALETAASAPCDFALLVSSPAPLVGGLGLLADAAAGFYLDAFAARRREVPWTSVAWDFFLDEATDAVRSIGLGAEARPAEGAACSVLPAFSQRNDPSPAAALQEAALDAIFRLLPVPHLIATPRRLGTAWNRVEAPAAPAVEPGGSYPRPELSTTYVAPRGETERRIAGIWEAMLGVDRIGVHDGFLDLGGDSLLAARLVARMRESFGLDLPVRLFFEASTIEQVAREVEALQAQAVREDEADVAELMALLDGFSEEEVEAELARRAGENP